ncbi:VOC family protein [Aquimarina sp. AD1]|uniref:VOC family protein n=1 Tax=Aquimarina sp. (strain AD1) TaxID=1714848 RepID=UPI000E481ADA|nr:VOC family protein [Aquimarina sp. AD1]AXT55808.1 VOC family protein [Aquimarina sp. AD1]RKN16380.1 VOC family protein [Aquimarina sp. AD1]
MVTWFEIPVIDMDRAKSFYEKVFEIEIAIHKVEGLQMGWFPNKNVTGEVTGSLILAGDHYKPSEDGVMIYFSCSDVANEISRVEDAGGKVLSKKTQISEEHGYMAYFVDSEGNRISLHSLR